MGLMRRATPPPGSTGLTSGTPIAVSVPSGAERWYRYTAPADGIVQVDWADEGTNIGSISATVGGTCPDPRNDGTTLLDGEDASNSHTGSGAIQAGELLRVWLECGDVLTGTLTATFTKRITPQMARTPSFSRQI